MDTVRTIHHRVSKYCMVPLTTKIAFVLIITSSDYPLLPDSSTCPRPLLAGPYEPHSVVAVYGCTTSIPVTQLERTD